MTNERYDEQTSGRGPGTAVMDEPSSPGTERAAQSVQAAGERVAETASGLIGQAREAALGRASEGKGQAGQQLRSAAEAIRQTSETLRDEQQTPLAKVADTAAERMEQAADYLQTRDVEELVGEAERFARREPALFLGGAFVVGLLAARFLKTTPAADGPSRSGGTVGGQYGTGAGTGGSAHAGTPSLQSGEAADAI
jgi:ElaB/YqjD/DUF883 family membrane-anchored ribosome-binding protein